MKAILIPAFLACLAISCHSPRKDKEVETQVSQAPPPPKEIQLPAGTVLPEVSCSVDPTQSYALFLPVQPSDSVRLPVMIFLDPQGDGSVPLDKYRSIAQRHPGILIGSNASKNGLTFEQTTQIIANLVREASLRWNASTVSLAGFSGGAKAALYAANDIPGLLTVIYCGASVAPRNPANLPPVLGFSGIRDMNYFETWNASQQLNGTSVPHAFFEWNGGHEWPDAAVFETAFSWRDFMAMRNHSIPRDEAGIMAFREKMLAELSRDMPPSRQVNICTQAIAYLSDLADVSRFREILSKASQSQQFMQDMQRRKEIYTLENNLKNNYMNCMDSKDARWWQSEIQRMRAVKGEDAAMYERLLGYISLVSYMYSRDAVSKNLFAPAQQYLLVYKMADPKNPEQPFLQACLYARQGNNLLALNSLQDAARLGFHDKARMESEPAFQALRSNEAYISLLRQE